MVKKVSLSILAALVMAVLALPHPSMAAGGLELFSLEEAKELNLDEAEWEQGAMPKSLSFGVGPKIVFAMPLVQETDKGLLIDSPSKMSLLVQFEDGVSAVDMKTLKIKARKGWFSKNLTDRLTPYLEGNSLKAENVKIPSGRFKLEIKISDVSGHESIQEYLCEIRD